MSHYFYNRWFYLLDVLCVNTYNFFWPIYSRNQIDKSLFPLKAILYIDILKNLTKWIIKVIRLKIKFEFHKKIYNISLKTKKLLLNLFYWTFIYKF